MDFSLKDDVIALDKRIRAFLKEEVEPLEAPLFEHGFEALAPQLAVARQRCKDAGLWAPALGKELGGMGLPLMDFAHVSETLGRTPLGHYVFNVQAPDIGNMECLHQHGTPAHQETYLKPLAAGETRSCFSMTEPMHAGSNPTIMSTVARRDGDDYVIDGRKWFTTGADGAAFAIVMAVTDQDAPRHRRATMIIVPTDTPGFVNARNIPVMGEPSGGWASHSEIVYEACRVPVSNRLGNEGDGFVIAQQRLGPGRIHHCMRWIGICERSFELMCERAATRMLAPGKPLASKQLVQAWIAESRAEIDAARLMVLRAAWRIDTVGAKAARVDISVIKFFVAGVLERVLDRAIQTHGAFGMVDELPLAYWYRHERGSRIYDGPDEVHKGVVARQVLKGYGGPESGGSR